MLNPTTQERVTEHTSLNVRGGNQRSLKICLMGAALDSGNRGVAALGASLVNLISQEREGAQITFLIGRRSSGAFTLNVHGQKRQIPVVNFRISPKAALGQQLWWIVLMVAAYRVVPFKWFRGNIARVSPWIRAVSEADWVGDIRGGDSFSDIYGLKRFLVGSLAVMSTIWVKGNIVLLPQTYGPFSSRIARWLARYILMRASVALSRDRTSLPIIETLTSGRCRGHFCPDVAFALDSIVPDEICIQPPLPAKDGDTLIGLNINGLMFNGGYNRANMFGLKLDYRKFLVRLVVSLLANPQNRLLLIPHTFAPRENVESDPAACEDIKSRLPSSLHDRVHVVIREYDQNEIKGIIGLCDFFIGSRMHACIAALSQNIPTIGVAYSKKFKGVFDSVGAGDWIIDGRFQSAEEGISKAMTLFENRETLRMDLAGKVQTAREKLRETFHRLVSP